VPNGTYVLRIAASDAPSNPGAATLTGHLDSSVFDIDNTPPVVRITGTRQDGVQTAIQIEVRDDMSTIDTVEYSVDGTRWEPIYPKDGIADSPVEEYEVMLGADAVRGAMIRATDALKNVGGASTEDGPRP
jgi:flavin-binding protein dodecin